MTSPGCIHTGGVRAKPTPPGVPVAMTSPGTSRVNEEKNSTALGTSTLGTTSLGTTTLGTTELGGEVRGGTGAVVVVTLGLWHTTGARKAGL